LPQRAGLLSSKAAALSVPRADVRLAFCEDCGYINNLLFEPALPPPPASGMLGTRQRRNGTKEAADRLSRCYDLTGKTLVQIGDAGDALVDELCRRAGARAGRVDPPFAEPQAGVPGPPPELLNADFILCESALTANRDAGALLAWLHDISALGHHPVLLLQTPDAMPTLRQAAFWRVDCGTGSYFSIGALARLTRMSGFDILNLAAGRHLWLEAVASAGEGGPMWDVEDDLAEMGRYVASFSARAEAKQREWTRTLRRAGRAGSRSVVWGCGPATATFLNTLDISGYVEYVVDMAAHGDGRFLAGTGHPVVPPDFLCEYRPETIIVIDLECLPEVELELERLGLRTELVTP
jgi:hypothetical protein